MSFYFPSVIFSIKEATEIAKTTLQFNANGYLYDPNLTIQKTFENYIKQPIMVIQETTQHTINILVDPYGIIQENPISNHRIALLQGDFEYLKSTIDLMIRMHPHVSPQTIVSSYSFKCTPQEKLKLKEYLKDTYHCF